MADPEGEGVGLGADEFHLEIVFSNNKKEKFISKVAYVWTFNP